MGSDAVERRRAVSVLNFIEWISRRVQEAEPRVQMRPADLIRLRGDLMREMYDLSDRLMDVAYGEPGLFAVNRRRRGKRASRRGSRLANASTDPPVHVIGAPGVRWRGYS